MVNFKANNICIWIRLREKKCSLDCNKTKSSTSFDRLTSLENSWKLFKRTWIFFYSSSVLFPYMPSTAVRSVVVNNSLSMVIEPICQSKSESVDTGFLSYKVVPLESLLSEVLRSSLIFSIHHSNLIIFPVLQDVCFTDTMLGSSTPRTSPLMKQFLLLKTHIVSYHY